MKLNIPVRLKNPWFWVGLAGVILAAMGVSPETLTSWEALKAAALGLVSNPYMLGSVLCAVLGVLVDPTTAGVGDSARVMTYSSPRKD